MVTRNNFAFCLKQVALYFKGMSKSIEFYNRIFLHVIPAHIIVPWRLQACHVTKMKSIMNTFYENNSKLSDQAPTSDVQKQPPEVLCKKDVLRNFAKFTGK